MALTGKEDYGVRHFRDIKRAFYRAKRKSPRKAAELAYVIAMIAKAGGKINEAIRFGRASVRLFKELNVQTLEECAARFVVVNDIALPSYIHEGVVVNRLSPLLSV